MRFALLTSALLCVAAVSLHAQDSKSSPLPGASPVKPEMPVGPLLQPAGAFAQWQVDFTYLDDKNKKEPNATPRPAPTEATARLLKTVITKTQWIIHEEQTFEANISTDAWFDHATKFTKSARNAMWYRLGSDSASNPVQATKYDPIPASGFRDLEMVNEKNYAGTMPYGNGDCFVFVEGGYQTVDLSDASKRQKRLEVLTRVIYVDATTRLPIAMRSGKELRTYHFGPPPTEMQTLPSDLLESVRKEREGRARLEKPAERPY